MKLEGSYTFDAPRDLVWEMFLDPEVLARIMPGCERLDHLGDNEYEGEMKIKVGPVQGVFKGRVHLTDLVAPESYHMSVNGGGPAGYVRGDGQVRLEETENGTIMHYSGDAQVSGRIAQVGQRLMTTSARAITDQSLEALDEQIRARVNGKPEEGEAERPGATAAPAGPSQTDFALGVARRMVQDALPEMPEDQQELMRAGVAVLAALLLVRLIVGWWTDLLARRVAYHVRKQSSE